MSDAIVEALRSVRPEAQRQVVLITDGAIGFETEVIREVSARLPAGSRLHTVGVGSSVNRALTARAARAGRGVEVVIGLGEDPERAVARLLARTSKPVLVELELGGSALREVAPSRLPDLFSGAPVLFGVRLSKEGGKIKVSGKLSSGSRFERELEVPPIAEMTNSAREGAALAALFARERVEDLELELAAGGSVQELDAEIEALGVKFGILTRLTSWVAVDELVSVDPTRPFRSVRQPHAVRYLCARARAPSLCQCRGDGWPAPLRSPWQHALPWTQNLLSASRHLARSELVPSQRSSGPWRGFSGAAPRRR